MHPDFEELEPEFGEVIDLLRAGPPPELDERPSPAVWDAIAAELGTDVPVETVPDVPIEDEQPHVGNGEAPDSIVAGTLRSLDEHRERRSPGAKRFAVLTAVAAAVLLIAVPVWLAVGGGASVEQQADLMALGQAEGVATGMAELTDGGELVLGVDGLEPIDGATYDLWLLDLEDGEVADLQWIGLVEGDDGVFSVPEDLDLDEFSVVDISIEPDDGDLSHSGNSVLRGMLADL